MSMRVGFSLRGRNPDVLTCIANISNDEVFTPPEFAGRMLFLFGGIVHHQLPPKQPDSTRPMPTILEP